MSRHLCGNCSQRNGRRSRRERYRRAHEFDAHEPDINPPDRRSALYWLFHNREVKKSGKDERKWRRARRLRTSVKLLSVFIDGVHTRDCL